MKYSIRIMPLAKADRRSMYDYIAERSPQGALAWEAAYEELLGRLENDLLRFGLAEEDPFFDFDLRQAIFKTKRGLPYRVLFRIEGDTIYILRLRGHGQAPVQGDDLPRR